MTTTQEQHTEPEDQGQRFVAVVGKVLTTIVYVYVVIVEMILALGFVLLLFGANPSSGLVEWVYRSMDRAMKPFRGIFAPVELGVAGNDVPSILETSVLFAMIIYAIVAVVLSSLLHWLTTRIQRIDRDNQVRELEQAHRDAELAYRQAVLQNQVAQQSTMAGTQPAAQPTTQSAPAAAPPPAPGAPMNEPPRPTS